MDRRVADIRRSAFEFVEGIERLSTTGEIMDAMGGVLNRHSVEYYLFTFIPTLTDTLKDVTAASRLPDGIDEVYAERGYVHDDPGFRHARTTVRPFRWFRDSPFDPEREPRAAEVVQLCRDFGLVEGIVVPVVSYARRAGQVWFGGATLDLPDSELPALHLMAIYAFDRILKLHGSPVQHQASLTPREREILTLAANGRSTREIGEKLHITSRTVKEHIKHLCRKLGAATRTQAVMIAVRDKIIQP